LDSATASFFINEEVGHFQRIKIVFAQISLSPFENEEVGLFQRIKIVFAQISLSPFENEEVGHFPANHTAQSRNERFGGNGPLGQVRYAHARGVRNNEIKEM
jgi:hypothetical protein